MIDNIEDEIGYFYSIKIKNNTTFHVCRYCGKEFKGFSVAHIKKYHSEEMDFAEHIKAHKDKKCNCSGVVYET
tara:strand:+ start:658 stop:876 length:219 start_codon:yes stop_codon:yes gene_type:complete